MNAKLEMLSLTQNLSQCLVSSIAERAILGLFAVTQIVISSLFHLEPDRLLFNLELR